MGENDRDEPDPLYERKKGITLRLNYSLTLEKRIVLLFEQLDSIWFRRYLGRKLVKVYESEWI